MSALRLPGPNGRVILVPIDDGARARIDRARHGTFGSLLTDAMRPFTGMTGLEVRAPRERRRTYRPRGNVIPRCAKPMIGQFDKRPSGETCGRRLNHGGGCKSVAAVERDNARRRTRDFG